MNKQNQKNKKIFLFILAVTMFFSQLNLAYAQEVYDYKAESGAQKSITDYLCTPKQPDGSGETLFECINKIYKFVIIVASVTAVLFIVIAGYVYMAAEGNQEAVDKAKNILITTVTALVILMGGYVLLKTINPDLVEFRSIQPLGMAAYLTGAGGTDPESSAPVAANAGGTCNEPDINYRQPATLGASACYTSSCDQYTSAIQSAANKINISGVNEIALIKAIMYRESSCNVNAQSGLGSCGLMQLQSETAQKFAGACGASGETITCEWLKKSNNASKAICMGAKYLEELSKIGCGTQIVDLAAGYNGGAKACNTSRDCSGKKAWECLYDNQEHTLCNTGYTETRNYAPKVAGCYNYYD